MTKIDTKLLVAFFLAAFCTFEAVGQATYPVTFQVDMSAALANCRLNATHDVSVNGSFNGWAAQVDLLTDADADSIFTGVVQLAEGTAIEYKFWAEGAALQWEDDPNRTYTVTADAEQILPVATFNKAVTDGCVTLELEALFQVHLGPSILTGDFDPATGNVLVAGPFTGWGGSTDTLDQQTFINDSLYAGVVNLGEWSTGDVIEFKYITKDADAVIGWENVNDQRTETQGGNRIIVVTGEETDSDENGVADVTLDVVFFNDIFYSDLVLFSEAATVAIAVDARPAYYFLEDNGFLPSDTQTGDTLFSFTNVYANGPFVSPLGWEDWGAGGLGSNESLKLVDDGTKGDAVAGDSVFTFQIDKAANARREGVVKFGLDGFDNESGFGADRVVLVEDSATPTASLIFGLVRNADGSLDDDSGPNINNADFTDAWDKYIIVNTIDNTATVVRSGGEDDIVVGIEDVGGEVPNRITLSNAYPNPFNPSTRFEYQLSRAEHVRVRIYNVMGQLVQTLVDEVQAASTYQVTFEAAGLASGTYFYRLETPGKVLSKAMILLK